MALVIDDFGVLKDIVKKTEIQGSEIEHYEGIIAPGFVNAHCHLELSHLFSQINPKTGLIEFLKQVITKRNNFNKKEQEDAAIEADFKMWESGIVAVGDISNINYHTFIELIGLNPLHSETIFEKGLSLLNELENYNLIGSLAAHAPFSSSKLLINKIANYNGLNNLAFSIHNQESEEETKFFAGRPSGINDLFAFLNIDINWFNPPKTSSLLSYLDLIPNKKSLLVHNTFCKEEDIIASKYKFINWCFCPGANLFIENTLPNFDLFLNHNQNWCIGTDSLASNQKLDMCFEASILLDKSPSISIESILKALTYNGAKALGIEDKFGKLIIGKNTGLNLIQHSDKQLNFIKKIA
jgi:cytosine/adenosine deaminase-related metal-dependent hydrolase